jgi:hypothetical protein
LSIRKVLNEVRQVMRLRGTQAASAGVLLVRGTVITREMVASPADSMPWALRARQDAGFFSGLRPASKS